MTKVLTFEAISKKTGITRQTVSNYSKKTGYKGEKLFNYIKNNVIGVDDTKKIKKNDNKKLQLLDITGNEPTNLQNAMISYNNIVVAMNSEDTNNALMLKLTDQLLKCDKRIDDIKNKIGFDDGESAIDD